MGKSDFSGWTFADRAVADTETMCRAVRLMVAEIRAGRVIDDLETIDRAAAGIEENLQRYRRARACHGGGDR